MFLPPLSINKLNRFAVILKLKNAFMKLPYTVYKMKVSRKFCELWTTSLFMPNRGIF